MGKGGIPGLPESGCLAKEEEFMDLLPAWGRRIVTCHWHEGGEREGNKENSEEDSACKCRAAR